MIEHRACPACGDSTDKSREIRRTSVHNRDEPGLPIRIVECGCGHVFLNPMPTLEELAPFYQSDYHVFAAQPADAAQTLARKRQGDRLDHALIVPGGKYLDVGCGLGGMVAAMGLLGMDAEGVEPSPIAAKRAKADGLRVYCGTLDQACYPDESFDVISLYHVLEHAQDPVALLAECRRILRPGGELLVCVPNFQSLVRSIIGWGWYNVDLPRHVHHFCQSSMRRASQRAGLVAFDIETVSMVQHVEGELTGWAKRQMKIPGRLTTWSRATWPLAAYLTAKGSRSGRGESIVAHFGKGSEIRPAQGSAIVTGDLPLPPIGLDPQPLHHSAFRSTA